MTLTLCPGEIRIFALKISNFCHIKKYRYRSYFNTLLILSIFGGSLRVIVIKVVAFLMISSKLATLGLPKINVL